MAKVIKQTFKHPEDKKPCLKFKVEDGTKKVPQTSMYLMKDAIEAAGAKPNRVSYVEVTYTIHEK